MPLPILAKLKNETVPVPTSFFFTAEFAEVAEKNPLYSKSQRSRRSLRLILLFVSCLVIDIEAVLGVKRYIFENGMVGGSKDSSVGVPPLSVRLLL